MRVWKVLVPVLALVWVALRGNPSLFELLLGLGFGFVAVAPFRRIYGYSVPVSRLPSIVLWFGVYVVVFAYEIVKANLGLAYLVVHPSLPIDPKVFEVGLQVETELGISLIANSITLTPGTLTLDYVDDRHVLRVHAIAGSKEDVVSPVDRLQRIAGRIGV